MVGRDKIMKKKKIAFIQPWGTYINDTLVCIGMNHQEVMAYMKKIHTRIEIAKDWVRDTPMINDVMGNGNALFWNSSGASVLWLKDWKDDWVHYDTIAHELIHALQAIMIKDKRMGGEDEAMAYQFEFLFREIRRKIWKKVGRK